MNLALKTWLLNTAAVIAGIAFVYGNQYWQLHRAPDDALQVIDKDNPQINTSIKLNNFQIRELKTQIVQHAHQIELLNDELSTLTASQDRVVNILEDLEVKVREVRTVKESENRVYREQSLKLYQELFLMHNELNRAQHPEWAEQGYVRLANVDMPGANPLHLEMLADTGGQPARLHNQLLAETRNPFWADEIEEAFGQFLRDQKLENQLSAKTIYCGETLCELQLQGQHKDQYQLFLNRLVDQFIQFSGRALVKQNQLLDYRGQGNQAGVFFLQRGDL